MCTQIEDIDMVYPLTSNQRREKCYRGIGLAIFNSFNEFPHLKRRGAENDSIIMSQLFASLNLEFRPHTELTKKQIVTLLEETAHDPMLSSDSMIAIAISSHGCKEGLLGINCEEPNYRNMDNCITPLQIKKIFNSENCKDLAGKPNYCY